MKKRIRRVPYSRSLPGPFAAHLFADWLERNRQRFLIQPWLSRVARRGAIINFPGVTAAVCARLSCDKDGGLAGINVWAEYRGRYWDYLAYMETMPRQRAGVYVCDFCDPALREIYLSREALWIGEVFEPFLAWCNTKLLLAQWLCLYHLKEMMTWAKLSSSVTPVDETEGQGAAIYLPIWVASPCQTSLPIKE